jgi:tripartite-type tricarboxylate transporter receptor subunit TctC
MRSHKAGLRESRLRLCRAPLAVVLAAIIGTFANDSARTEPGFPAKPIRISIPFGAGGVADLTMRLLAQGLTERLG